MFSSMADSAAVALDERAVRGAPRQRLEAERAAAGIEVGDRAPTTTSRLASALNTASRTLSVVGRVRSRRRRAELPPPQFPGHDPHPARE